MKSILYKKSVYGKNLADELDDDRLNEIGEQVIRGFDVDEESCSDWAKRTEPAMDLAMQVYTEKNFPFSNASNVKYPLIATAAMQFSARCFPNIIKGSDVVKCKVVGRDAPVALVLDPATGEPIVDRQTGQPIPITKSMVAERISTHMSYQVTEEMPEWETDLDRGLVCFPVVGEEWKKTYFDSVTKKNKSVRVPSENMTINYWAKSTESAQRITERIPVYPNVVEECKRSGFYRDIEYDIDTDGENREQNSEDEDSPLIFLEQHCWLDLDDDGYKEPYIVTVHKASRKVARVYVRFEQKDVIRKDGKIIKILPTHYYTHMVFFPSPDGGSRGMGFGNLLGPINEAINTNINQLIDAGTAYNSNTGFIGKGAQLGRARSGGQVTFELNEWKEVPMFGEDMRKSIVPMPVKEPSMVLFSLLGMLIDAGKQLSSVSEVMTGQTPGANASPTTVMALAEQGQQVFTSIYKRVHRALKSEFKKLFRLNSIYLDDKQYYRITDEEMVVAKSDYNMDGLDVVPVSDPTEISDMHQAYKADALRNMLGQGFNDQEIRKRLLELMKLPDAQALLLPDEALSRPDPEIELKKRQIVLDEKKFLWKVIMDRSQMAKNHAAAFKLREEGEAIRPGVQMDELALAQKRMEILNQEAERFFNERVIGVGGQPANQGVPQGGGGPEAQPGTGDGSGGNVGGP